MTKNKTQLYSKGIPDRSVKLTDRRKTVGYTEQRVVRHKQVRKQLRELHKCLALSAWFLPFHANSGSRINIKGVKTFRAPPDNSSAQSNLIGNIVAHKNKLAKQIIEEQQWEKKAPFWMQFQFFPDTHTHTRARLFVSSCLCLAHNIKPFTGKQYPKDILLGLNGILVHSQSLVPLLIEEETRDRMKP